MKGIQYVLGRSEKYPGFLAGDSLQQVLLQGLACGNGMYSFRFCEQDLGKTKPVSLGKQEKRSFFGKFWKKIHSLKKPSGFQMHHRKS